MEQREKLVELLSPLMLTQNAFLPTMAADYLIKHGVVVLPCNASVIEWHKITTRPPTNQEKEWYEEHEEDAPEYIFECEMPEDDEEILIASKWGVGTDICCNDWDYGIGLEVHGDWDGVLAWAEMPKYEVSE